MSLRLKILLPVILLITAIVCSIAVIAYKESADALRESLYNNMQKQAENMATNSLSFARQVESDAMRSASRPDVAAFLLGDTKEKQRLDATNAMLKALDETYPDITRIQILTPDGLVAASSNPSTVGSDFSKRDYFLVPHQQGKGYRAPAFVSTVTKSSVMVSSAPIIHEGKVLGVLTCTISLDNYYRNYVQTINISETGFGYMINSKGEIILHREFEKLFKPDLPITPYLKQAAAATEPGVIDFTGADGKRMILYHVPSPSDNNTAVIQAEYDDVFGPLNTIRRTSIIISAVALLAGLLCVFLVVNPVVRALRNGATFANQVKNGNLDGRLEVRRNDEIGSLAEALRSIPTSLKGITGEYASLEERVENGELDAQGAAEKFQGDFAALVNGTNSILARFRTVLDNIPSPVLIMDGELRAIYMNRAGAQAAGVEWRNRTVADLFRLSAAEKLAEARSRQVSGEAEANFNGSAVEVQYNCIPLTDSTGKTRSLLLLLTDITAIKSAQRTMTEVAQGAFDIAHRVATASEELSAQVEQVSIGTTRQHELVSSTAAAMEQMNSSILEVARNSEQANEQAGMTRDNASQGAGLVSQVTEAMSDVNSTTGELRLSMEELGTKVDSIGAVMNVITDIADQTNLLALNAAIEAARAGEAGRGFSVVADEVRKLAEKTMLATREVEESIKGIQTATKVNLRKVEETSSSVEKATELTGRSKDTLESILDLAHGNSTLISGIAAAIEQQSASSEEINRSIDDISQVATETAGGMEQAEGAVQELAALANQLNEQLQRLNPATAA